MTNMEPLITPFAKNLRATSFLPLIRGVNAGRGELPGHKEPYPPAEGIPIDVVSQRHTICRGNYSEIDPMRSFR